MKSVMKREKPGPIKDILGFGAFGVIWAAMAMILGGAALGYVVDSLLDTFPIFLIVMMLMGIAGGFWKAYRAIMKDFDNKE